MAAFPGNSGGIWLIVIIDRFIVFVHTHFSTIERSYYEKLLDAIYRVVYFLGRSLFWL